MSANNSGAPEFSMGRFAVMAAPKASAHPMVSVMRVRAHHGMHFGLTHRTVSSTVGKTRNPTVQARVGQFVVTGTL